MSEIDLGLLGPVVEAMDEGVGIFNPDGLLIACNACYAAVQKDLGGDARLSVRWQELIWAGLRRGKIPEARGREGAWLEQRCQLRGAYSALHHTPNGRVYKVHERRIANGGMVVVWTEVTELLVEEEAASTSAASRNAILTDREREVLRLLVLGLPMKAVARMLNITARTVAFHKYQAMRVNGLSNNADLLRFAMEQGLLATTVRPEVSLQH